MCLKNRLAHAGCHSGGQRNEVTVVVLYRRCGVVQSQLLFQLFRGYLKESKGQGHVAALCLLEVLFALPQRTDEGDGGGKTASHCKERATEWP